MHLLPAWVKVGIELGFELHVVLPPAALKLDVHGTSVSHRLH